MSDDIYYEKYLKYKNKYLQLKNQEGGLGGKASYGIGYMFMTDEEYKSFTATIPDITAKKEADKEREKSKTPIAFQLKDFDKFIPKIKLTNLKTLKKLIYSNFIGTEDKVKLSLAPTFSNYMTEPDPEHPFLLGVNEVLNNQIITTIKADIKAKIIKNSKSRVVIFILVIPAYKVYLDINSSNNIILNNFVLDV